MKQKHYSFQKPGIQNVIKSEDGMILIMSLALLAVLALVGTIAINTTTTELKISTNYKSNIQAFYIADAGAEHAKVDLTNTSFDDVLDGTYSGGGSPGILSFGTDTFFAGGTYTVRVYDDDDGDGDSLDDINNKVKIIGTGTVSSGAYRTIEVVVSKQLAFQYGIFGDISVDMKNNGSVYSYDSSSITSPGPSDSTGNGDIGSNGSVVLKNGTLVDGDVGLGDNGAGIEATITDAGATVNGTISDAEREDPDPLGAMGGSLATDIATYAISNDNANAPEIGVDLTIDEDTALTVGNYYIECINLGNNDELTISPGAGTINIYMSNGCGNGKLIEAGVNADIFILGNPTQLNFFTDSTDSISFKHGTEFYGMVYAPYASVEMKNSADAYGLIFANTVSIKNSGEFYFDTAILDNFTSDDITVVSWREIIY